MFACYCIAAEEQNWDVYWCCLFLHPEEDSLTCATPTVVLVWRQVMNSTAGYDVTLISVSVMGFRGFDGMCSTNCGACFKTADELHSRLWCYIDMNESYGLQRIRWRVPHQLWCMFEDWWWTPQKVMMLHWYQWVLSPSVCLLFVSCFEK